MKIELDQARRVLDVVDKGLCNGIGEPIPGKMCVEAAVCYALGQPHGDEPACVHRVVRKFKIALNDKEWSSNEARAKGMRRIAIAQLGSVDSLDVEKFRAVLSEQTIRRIVPVALRAVAGMKAHGAFRERLEAAALRCEKEGTRDAAMEAKTYAADAADAAYAAAYAAYAASDAYAAYAAAADAAKINRDEILSICAEIGVEALRAAGSPGAELMDQLIPA